MSANDQKAAAALVIHALLFAGVTAVADKLGPIYEEASALEHTLGLVLVFAALGLFLASVLAFLLAVSPYRPVAIHQDLKDGYRGVFFPDLQALVGDPGVGTPAWFAPRLRLSMLPGFRRRTLFGRRAPGTRSPLMQAMALRVEGMDAADVNRELMAEVLKLKDVLDWESGCARWGYRLLALELVAMTGFFVLAILVASHHA